MYTEYLDVKYGVKQGHLLSPLLFNLFIYDLAIDTNNERGGVEEDIDYVIILLYVNYCCIDFKRFWKSSTNLSCLHECYKKWQIYINAIKSKVVHF